LLALHKRWREEVPGRLGFANLALGEVKLIHIARSYSQLFLQLWAFLIGPVATLLAFPMAKPTLEAWLGSH
jgi:hypothetical protein